MEQYDNKYKWSQAASKGLILSATCIVFTAVAYLNISPLLNTVLQLARTVACIWMLVRFMQEYYSTTGNQPMSFAMATVLLSSVICAFFDAASYMWLFPELKATMETSFSEVIAQVPEQGREIVENMMDGMPKWLLIVGFIKNYLIGWITAAIANSKISSNIFDGKEEEEDELA